MVLVSGVLGRLVVEAVVRVVLEVVAGGVSVTTDQAGVLVLTVSLTPPLFSTPVAS